MRFLLRALTRLAAQPTTYCTGCGGWYNPGDPASWAEHKSCR